MSIQAAEAHEWLLKNGMKNFEAHTKDEDDKSFKGTYFSTGTDPSGIHTALQAYAKRNKDGGQKFVLVIVGDGAFTESLNPYLTSCVQEGLLNDCVHVILSVPPEAVDQMNKHKNQIER